MSKLEMSFTGFDTFELDKFLSVAPEDEARAEECPELPLVAVSQPGDLWRLGEHRVLCGDSTASDSVSRLLGAASGGVTPLLMVTDPPYGVEYDPTWRDGKGGFSTAPVKQRGTVQNDDRVDWRQAYELFPGDVLYVWHGGIAAGEFAASIFSAGFQIRAQIIWRKQQSVFGRGAYHWQHEPCWYAVRKGSPAHWRGDRKQSTIWDIPNLNPTGNRKEDRVGHGTQKPIECMKRPILNHTKRGEAVYDPFLGSGTTLIAADLTGRVCFGLELDPKYVDVIVQRWENQTGKAATLDGHRCTFEQAKQGRRMQAEDAIKEEVMEANALCG